VARAHRALAHTALARQLQQLGGACEVPRSTHASLVEEGELEERRGGLAQAGAFSPARAPSARLCAADEYSRMSAPEQRFCRILGDADALVVPVCYAERGV
jgi:hypothetical protein